MSTADDPTTPPVEHEAPPLRRAESVVVVNTGHGKGKSSAAFGVVLRAVARDWRVAVVQFLKSGKWRTGEERTGRRLGVDWWTIGEGFTWESDDLDVDREVACRAWEHAAAIIAAGGHRLVVLDEVTYPMNWGWIGTDEVVATIAGRPSDVSVIATGRDAPDALVDVADTVTEMHKVKHAHDRGIRALRGVDY